MSRVDPRTPVLVGAGVAHQPSTTRTRRSKPIELMAQACERAAHTRRRCSATRAVDPRAARHVALPRSRAAPADAVRRRRPHGDRRVRHPPADAVHARVHRDRDRRARRRRWSSAARPSTAISAPRSPARVRRRPSSGTSCADDVLVPAAEIIPPIEIAAGLTIPRRCSTRSIETALRAARGETVATHARASGRAVGRRSARSPRPTPTRGAVTRSTPEFLVVAVGQEPDARGAVHEMALLAVERRPGVGVRALLGRRRRALRRAHATGGCSRSRRSSRTPWCRCRSAASCTGPLR